MRGISIVGALIACVLTFATPASALGPLPGHPVHRTIDRAGKTIFALEQQAVRDAHELLNRLNSIIKESMDRLDTMRKDAVQDITALMNELEIKVQGVLDDANQKLSELIDKAECSAKAALEQSLQDVLQKVTFFGDKMKIVAPVLYAGECSGVFSCAPITKEFTIYPNQYYVTYKAVRDYLIDQRLREAGNDTPILSLVETYGTIANLAWKTACFDRARRDTFRDDYVNFKNKAAVWSRLFGAQVGQEK